MNDLQNFDFNGLTVRAMQDDHNGPLFCLADVCKALELTNSSMVLQQLKEEFGDNLSLTYPITDALGRSQKATFITEPQLYFVMMRSRAERAKEFRRWVCDEVLPAIRRTGVYATPAAAEEMLNNPDFLIKTLQALKDARAERDEAIRTKAQIGSRREATAMNVAAKFSKANKKLKAENEQLKDMLGEGAQYKTVSAKEKELKKIFNLDGKKAAVCRSQIGKQLTQISKEMKCEPKEVDHVKYGLVKAYHINVWSEFERLINADADYMGKYRRNAKK